MLRKSFRAKLIFPVVIAMFLMILILTVVSSVRFSDFNNQLVSERLTLATASMKDDVEYQKESSCAAATMMAKDRDAVEAVKSGDRNKVIEVFTSAIDLFGISYFTISDAEGNVIVRTYDTSKYGDSVAGQQNVKDAIAGKISTYLESGTEIKVSIRTGAPMYDDDGTMIGIVSAGVRLDTDAYVDKLKRVYSVEATVFLGDTRYATTIIQNGERVVGTQLKKEVADIVLGNKSEYLGETDILGEKYKASYVPLFNAKNEAFAIVFMGISTQHITDQTNSFIIYSSLIGGALLIASVFILVLITGAISKPIVTLKGVFRDFTNGKLNSNIEIKSRDELGQLGQDFRKVADIFRTLLDDVNEMVDEQEKGNTDFRIESEKYSGDYKKLADNVMSLAETFRKDTTSLLEVLTEFNGGNFDADIPKMPGKKIAINHRIDGIRDSMKKISAEIGGLTAQAINGNLSARADANQYSGDWKAIIEGLNSLLGAVVEPINEVSLVLNEISKGNFTASMKGNYRGDFNAIKVSVNGTVANISEYIKEISSVLNELASDNLDMEISREYVGEFASIKSSLNNIINKLNGFMNEINSASEQVALGARQLSESSMALAQGAAEQASSVEELNATVLSINEKTKINAENADKAKELSSLSSESAAIGNSDMGRMLAAMEDIRQSSTNISRIIKTIQDISFQTNLLALNASIEAAHAGVHGAGFSVVAEEVRNLAEKSQIAAKETTDMIESSIQKVNEGTEIAEQTAKTLGRIVSSVSEVSGIIAEISDSSDEQAIAISQINLGVNKIAEVVQSNSATSEESASSSQELSSQSELLKNMIQVFKLKNR